MEKNLEAVKVVVNKALEDAFSQGFEEGKKSVQNKIAPALKTVNRIAEVGEEILVTNPRLNTGYGLGDVLKVIEKGSMQVIADGMVNGCYLYHGEYEVIAPQLKTVKRKAEIGERILIVDANASNGQLGESYKNGDILTVTEQNQCEDDVTCGVFDYINGCEYEVIIEEPTELPVPIKSPNEQRAELIERERQYVEKNDDTSWKTKKPVFIVNGLLLVPEYVVNEKKNTVVCILRGHAIPRIYYKGIAKCMPGDVFNATLGKSIALRKAKRERIPHDLMHAVQPDEVVEGMKINYSDSDKNLTVLKFVEGRIRRNPTSETYLCTAQGEDYKIINDTNAVYADDTQ